VGTDFRVVNVNYRGRVNGVPNKGDGLTNASYSTQDIRNAIEGPLKNVFVKYRGQQKLEIDIGCNAALPPLILRVQLPAFGSFTCQFYARDTNSGRVVYGPVNVNAGNAFYIHHKPKDMVRILSDLIVKEVGKTMLGASTKNGG
jgi:hypothetical protein